VGCGGGDQCGDGAGHGGEESNAHVEISFWGMFIEIDK
jgi:hypothetical protein